MSSMKVIFLVFISSRGITHIARKTACDEHREQCRRVSDERNDRVFNDPAASFESGD